MEPKMKVGRETSKSVVRAVRFGVLYLVIGLAGCSFHSNQWNALSSLWRQDQGPQKNWQVRWLNRTFDVYAINTDQEVIFADGEGFILRFDGWQVTQVQGLLPGQNTLNIAIEPLSDGTGVSLEYQGKGSRFGEHQCTNWALKDSLDSNDPDEYVVYEQDCTTATGPVTHSIALNGERQLMALSFTLHPMRGPASVRFIGY